MKKDAVISLTRVAAMIMIVLCHIFTYLEMGLLAQIFNVGVNVFFLISGILFANHEIEDKKHFLKKRWLKVCIQKIAHY